MNINRNNYEEFFLMYVDNELSAAERNAVELFVRDNADLQEELNMLQETVMQADSITFENKDSLLKQELTALQENLLLYIDDELSAAEKFNTEKLIKKDIVANKELLLLQQTKLQADTAIVFAGKEILYRKEGGRVIGMPWKRIAAAAVLLGFGTWLTLSLVKTGNHAVTPAEVANNNGAKTITPVQNNKNATGTEVITAQDKAAITDKNTSTGIANTTGEIKPAAQKNELIVADKVPQQNATLQKEADHNNTIAALQPDIKKPSNNLPTPVYKNINNLPSNLTTSIDVTHKSAVIDIENSGNKNIVIAASNQTGDAIEGYALNTKFTEGDNDQEEDHNKKSKLGGFFRKVKRIVERNTNVQTGNGVKIAGFDIAIK